MTLAQVLGLVCLVVRMGLSEEKRNDGLCRGGDGFRGPTNGVCLRNGVYGSRNGMQWLMPEGNGV